MAQHVIPDTEEMMECPFDKTHKVSARVVQTHLINCRKNNPGKDFKRCPFNALHEMPKAEYRCHLAVCPDKVVLHQELDLVSANSPLDTVTIYQRTLDVVGSVKNSTHLQSQQGPPFAVTVYQRTPDIASSELNRNQVHCYKASRNEGNLFKGCTETPVYNEMIIPTTEDWDSDENTAPFQPQHMPLANNVWRGMATGGPPGVGLSMMDGFGPGTGAPPSGFCVN